MYKIYTNPVRIYIWSDIGISVTFSPILRDSALPFLLRRRQGVSTRGWSSQLVRRLPPGGPWVPRVATEPSRYTWRSPGRTGCARSACRDLCPSSLISGPWAWQSHRDHTQPGKNTHKKKFKFYISNLNSTLKWRFQIIIFVISPPGFEEKWDDSKQKII